MIAAVEQLNNHCACVSVTGKRINQIATPNYIFLPFVAVITKPRNCNFCRFWHFPIK